MVERGALAGVVICETKPTRAELVEKVCANLRQLLLSGVERA